MSTKTIPWNSGGGNIKITYMGSGNGITFYIEVGNGLVQRIKNLENE